VPVGEEYDEEEFVAVPFPQCLQVLTVVTFHQLPSTLRMHLLWNNSEEMTRCHEVMGSPVVIFLRKVGLILGALFEYHASVVT
jgi:hypothetical protein